MPENTELVDAGDIRIGVEHRVLNPDLIRASIPDEELAITREINPNLDVLTITDRGVSLHVLDQSGIEWLRFDGFEGTAHYHYIGLDSGKNLIVDYDSVANGDLIDWAIDRICDRLPEMLREAGNEELAATVDLRAVAAAVPEIRAAIERARTHLAAVDAPV